MILGVILVIGPALVLAGIATWQCRVILRLLRENARQHERIIELEAKVAERSGDVITIGRTLLAERASHFGREREAALGRGQGIK